MLVRRPKQQDESLMRVRGRSDAGTFEFLLRESKKWSLPKPRLVRLQTFREAFEIMPMEKDDATTRAVNVRNEKERY